MTQYFDILLVDLMYHILTVHCTEAHLLLKWTPIRDNVPP